MTISVASTVVLTRVLTDKRALHTPTGHVAWVGWTATRPGQKPPAGHTFKPESGNFTENLWG